MLFSVAIIDTGVDLSHRRLVGANISGINIHKLGTRIQVRTQNLTDMTGHGTAIAGIIHAHVPNISLINVKLSSDVEIITEDLLVEAILWCLNRGDIKVINISMGLATKTPSQELYDACKLAQQQNVLICAAAHNFPHFDCYPAYFPTVFGVGAGIVKSKKQFKFLEDSPVNVLAKGTVQRVASIHNEFSITSGTSMATAHFTGILSTLLVNELGSMSWDSTVNLLKKRSSDEVAKLNYTRDSKDWEIGISETSARDSLLKTTEYLSRTKKIALFPVDEKEINTIVEFSDLCKFEVTQYLSYPAVYVPARSEDNRRQVIRRYLRDDEFDSFDTLVVGYFFDQPFDGNILYGMTLIKQCIQRNKSFVVWDEHVHRFIKTEIANSNTEYLGNICYSDVDNKVMHKILGLRLGGKPKKPMLAVIGTGSNQGKITCQLRIKKLLEKTGYRTSLISTEPQGVLFGADFVFPFGHKSTVSIPYNDWSPFLRSVVIGIERFKQPDLFLTGLQGGLLKKMPIYDESGGNILKNLHYLLGIAADSAICTLSPTDDVAFIERTLDTLNSFLKVNVIFYSLTPYYHKFDRDSTRAASRLRLSQAEFQEKLEYYNKNLDAPVIDILDTDNDEFIVNAIVGAFSNADRHAERPIISYNNR